MGRVTFDIFSKLAHKKMGDRYMPQTYLDVSFTLCNALYQEESFLGDHRISFLFFFPSTIYVYAKKCPK